VLRNVASTDEIEVPAETPRVTRAHREPPVQSGSIPPVTCCAASGLPGSGPSAGSDLTTVALPNGAEPPSPLEIETLTSPGPVWFQLRPTIVDQIPEQASTVLVEAGPLEDPAADPRVSR
jgi:hypothetical protein